MTKMFFGNQYVGSFNCDGKKYSKFQIFKMKTMRLIRRVFFVAFVIQALGWTAVGGYNYAKQNISPQIAWAEKVVKVEVESSAPVLKRIAKCESGDTHFDKNGQVLMRSNTNKSVDIGRYQINESAWGKKATELGLNLTVEKDNETMAKWIYANRGTEDWYSSKNCWQK